jgi:hypothetical protein
MKPIKPKSKKVRKPTDKQMLNWLQRSGKDLFETKGLWSCGKSIWNPTVREAIMGAMLLEKIDKAKEKTLAEISLRY